MHPSTRYLFYWDCQRSQCRLFIPPLTSQKRVHSRHNGWFTIFNSIFSLNFDNFRILSTNFLSFRCRLLSLTFHRSFRDNSHSFLQWITQWFQITAFAKSSSDCIVDFLEARASWMLRSGWRTINAIKKHRSVIFSSVKRFIFLVNHDIPSRDLFNSNIRRWATLEIRKKTFFFRVS